MRPRVQRDVGEQRRQRVDLATGDFRGVTCGYAETCIARRRAQRCDQAFDQTGPAVASIEQEPADVAALREQTAAEPGQERCLPESSRCPHDADRGIAQPICVAREPRFRRWHAPQPRRRDLQDETRIDGGRRHGEQGSRGVRAQCAER